MRPIFKVPCLFFFFQKCFPLPIQVAVCNLASIALNKYVSPGRTFDFNKLTSVTKVIVKNLNKIIDINYYPVPEVCCDTCVAPLSQTHPSVLYSSR